MIEILQAWQIQSQNVAAEQNVSSIFLCYVLLCFIINRPVFLLAFLLPEALYQLSIFDAISNTNKYLIEIVLYTYIFDICTTVKSKLSCGIIVLITMLFAVDEYLFGLNGVIVESETFIYANISNINTCAHLLFISSLIPYQRIRNRLRRMLTNIVRSESSSYFIQVMLYNISKIKKTDEELRWIAQRNF